MLAQAMMEYGGLQSIAASFASAYNRVENYLGQGNLKYLLLVLVVIIILLLVKRRRTY